MKSIFLAAAVAIAASASVPAQAQMPGLVGSQHIGLTVPDVDDASAFFVEVLGCKRFFEIGPFGPFEDDWMTENLNVHPRAVAERLVFIRCGNGPAMELFKYVSPDQETVQPKNSDIGGYHVAFYVDDMAAAVAYLRENGVKVLADAHRIDEGPLGGLEWVYFLAPWGMQMELVSSPTGLGYESTMPGRLWDPRF
ncbi:VOC family protein [Paralimibaculum aggregatum]|uniref:VOC family protein n=1 Tax=Paralimibaculum aggregatum TaxID=3036245 RepID=A0ABQ6LSX8_9RHOB|nr:VOC family protein [Limibaculum sp. NKW23]GMG85193.1 VOC family protein [Limibaculum sp. NKW23]